MKRLFTLILAGLLLAGCAGTDSRQQANTQQTQAAGAGLQDGGTLRLAMNMTTTLNPLLNADVTVDRVLSLMFEPLARIDGTGQVVPHIAESWNYDESGLVLTLKIDTARCWHDGSAITAADVA